MCSTWWGPAHPVRKCGARPTPPLSARPRSIPTPTPSHPPSHPPMQWPPIAVQECPLDRRYVCMAGAVHSEGKALLTGRSEFCCKFLEFVTRLGRVRARRGQKLWPRMPDSQIASWLFCGITGDAAFCSGRSCKATPGTQSGSSGEPQKEVPCPSAVPIGTVTVMTACYGQYAHCMEYVLFSSAACAMLSLSDCLTAGPGTRPPRSHVRRGGGSSTVGQ